MHKTMQQSHTKWPHNHSESTNAFSRFAGGAVLGTTAGTAILGPAGTIAGAIVGGAIGVSAVHLVANLARKSRKSRS